MIKTTNLTLGVLNKIQVLEGRVRALETALMDAESELKTKDNLLEEVRGLHAKLRHRYSNLHSASKRETKCPKCGGWMYLDTIQTKRGSSLRKAYLNCGSCDHTMTELRAPVDTFVQAIGPAVSDCLTRYRTLQSNLIKALNEI